MSELKKKITDVIYTWTLSFITTENVQRLLLVICDKLGEKAIQTENQIDDVMVDAFRTIVSNPEKVKVITDNILTYLKNPKECRDDEDHFERLAEYVSCAGESVEVTGIPILLIARILELVVPYIIEYFMNRE